MTALNGTLPGLPAPRDNKWQAKRVIREDLMPCPFCGQPPELVTYTHPEWGTRFQILCCGSECNTVCGTTRQTSFEVAVNIWSTRPTITKVDMNDLLTALDDNEFHEA